MLAVSGETRQRSGATAGSWAAAVSGRSEIEPIFGMAEAVGVFRRLADREGNSDIGIPWSEFKKVYPEHQTGFLFSPVYTGNVTLTEAKELVASTLLFLKQWEARNPTQPADSKEKYREGMLHFLRTARRIMNYSDNDFPAMSMKLIMEVKDGQISHDQAQSRTRADESGYFKREASTPQIIEIAKEFTLSDTLAYHNNQRGRGNS